MRHRRTLLAGIVLAGTVLVPPTSHAAVAGFCAAPGFDAAHTHRWQVGNGDWIQPGAWTHGIPGQAGYTANTDYACIGNGVTVTMDGSMGEFAGLAAIDIGEGARLVINGGSHLFVNDTAQPSIVRAGSALADQKSTLGGFGTIQVFGTLHVTSRPTGAATITTRNCDVGAGCSHAARAPGTITIERHGALLVDGPTRGGINLEDKYVIDNFGLLKLTGAGYVAADWGTVINNRAGGRIAIANDGGIYEGRHRYALPHLARITDFGDLAKTGGTGTSVIGVDFSRKPGGTVTVKSGTLVINGSAVPTANVDQGHAYGNGTCVSDNQQPCHEPTSSADKQTTTIALPAAFPGSAQVSIAEGAPPASLPNHIGKSVHVTTPGAQATAAHPMRFTFNFLQSAYPRLAGNHWREVRLFRSDGGAYTQIHHCLASGKPRTGEHSCLDLRPVSGASSVSGGVVHLVVRTVQNSRWVVV